MMIYWNMYLYAKKKRFILTFLKGDGALFSFEMSTEYPHIFQLSTVTFDGLHQALSFLPKTSCDVRKVEFAKAWRLTNTTVEPVSFIIPRIKVS